MKTLFLKLSLLLLVLCSLSLQAQVLDLDPVKSKIKWTGKKIAGGHEGFISVNSGSLTINEGKVSDGNVNVDMQSMTCTDIESPKYNKKLLDHLKNEDFFSVDSFPEAILSNIQGELASLKGDLTIKGLTLPIEFSTKLEEQGTEIMVQGQMVIDRTKYGIRYKSKSFFESAADNFIYDDFTLDYLLYFKQRTTD